MDRTRHARGVDGILIVDKPAGVSSNAVLQRVKRIYAARKAGHTGSLDPLATGVLPICFGEATKWSQYLLGADKHYLATLCLGRTTVTDDADGRVLEVRSAATINVADVDAVLRRFRGGITQVPPMYSALKREGVPLYRLARRGIDVERAPREVSIHALEAIEFDSGEQARLVLQVRVSKGTYVRTLAADIGAALGCGAHLSALRRTAAGPFAVADAARIEDLQRSREESEFADLDRLLLPSERAVVHLPEVRIEEPGCSRLARGQAIQVAGVSARGAVRIATREGLFRGVGEITDDCRVVPRRMTATRDTRP